MADELAVTFGQLLRRLRKDAGLTIDELSRRSDVSVRAISDLELGKATLPHESTAAQLAQGLKLQGRARDVFQAAARGQPVPDGFPFVSVTSPPQMLPRDIAGFTGRTAELSQLLQHAARGHGVVSIHAISGMAGIGKTALAVRAAHQLAARFPDGQIFLELNAHTPGQRPVDPADALASLLEAAGADARQIPRGLSARARLWRHWLADRQVLLVFDDAADSEQVRPLLPGTARSLVLITSRRKLAALEDTRAVSLDVLAENEAAELVVRLADRPGLQRDDPAVRQLTRLCGNLPLALHTATAASRHLARRTPARSPAAFGRQPAHSPDIPTRQQATAWMGAERLNLEASVSYAAAHGYPAHAAAIPAAMHGFLRSTGHWDQALTLHQAALAVVEGEGDLLGQAMALTDLADVQYLTGDYGTADVSLTRALDVSRGLGNPIAEANVLVQLGVLRQATSNFPAAIASLESALDLSRSRHDLLGEALALNNLGAVQFLTGNPAAAVASEQRALDIYRLLEDELGQASALNSLGGVQQATGDYLTAAENLTQALRLYQRLGDRIGEAYATGNLGAVQCIVGDQAGAADNLGKALEIYRDLGSRGGEADTLNNLGALNRAAGNYQDAADNLTQALRIYQDLGDQLGEAGALSELGVLQHATQHYSSAEANLTRAVEISHQIGESGDEAEALNNLGDLYLDLEAVADARDKYTRAAAIAIETESRLQEARALEGIGRCLIEENKRADGMEMLRRSLVIYEGIGSPNAKRVARMLGTPEG